jgi:predicted P-loop ATPase
MREPPIWEGDPELRARADEERKKNRKANGPDPGPPDPDSAKASRRCPPAMQREATFERDPMWRRRLLLDSKKQIRACIANVITALRHTPEWDDRLWFDLFHNRVVLRGAPPWSDKKHRDEPWSDLLDNLTTDWMNHHDIFASREVVGHAVWTVAHDQWFHPVRQYLERCRKQWDGQNRVANWATTILGTPLTAYSKAVGQRWPISLVARVMEPGCKADCALVLEGDQGIFKSEVLRRLGTPWFTDDLGGSQLGSKDAAIQVAGIWILELAELDEHTRVESNVTKTKSFMSRSTDRFRPPYGTHSLPQPRQCCFGCTTNKREYLPDETGNRRWWPLVCESINLDQLDTIRDQLFGEAVALYEAGEPWWLDTPGLNALAATEQAMRSVPDSWDEPISNYLDHPTEQRDDPDKPGRKITVALPPLESVTVGEILEKVIGLDIGKWGQREENRVAKSLRKLCWERKQNRIPGDREWRYRRPKPEG